MDEIAAAISEDDKVIYDTLVEIFGTSEELHNCIDEVNSVVKSFLMANSILGINIPQQSQIRLQKATLLFDLLLAVGYEDKNDGQSEPN